MNSSIIRPVRHGLLLAALAMILGVCWAAYLATHHEQLHGGFEQQEAALKASRSGQAQDAHRHAMTDMLRPEAEAHSDHDDDHAEPPHQHSHSGSLALDAMRRLLRGHVHWMGVGILSTVMLLITAFTSLKPRWKGLLGWTFGIGAIAYPPAWILMGFRTVRMGPKTAEESVLWLFGPAAGLILASLIAVFAVLLLEMFCPNKCCGFFSRCFEQGDEHA